MHKQYFDSPLYCSRQSAAVLPSINFWTSGSSHTLNHLYLFATVPIHFKLNFRSFFVLFSLSFSVLPILRPSHPYFSDTKPVSTVEVASSAKSKVNRAMLVLLMDAFETTNIRANFNIGRLHVKWFLKWIMFSNIVQAKKIGDVMRAKAYALSMSMRLKMLSGFSDPNLLEIGTKQVWQVVRASLAVVPFAEKDPLLSKFFCTLFRVVLSSEALTSGINF